MTKSINDTVNHDFPTNKFVVPVNVPKDIWMLYIVFMSFLYLAVLKKLVHMINFVK